MVRSHHLMVASFEEATSNLTVAQCVLTLGGYDTNVDQLINRTEFSDVVSELCPSIPTNEEIWDDVFLEAACLCQSFDENSDDCCNVNPVIRRPGQYAKEYTFTVCSFLYEQFAQYDCMNDTQMTETPTSAPIASITSPNQSSVIDAPTMAPSLSNVSIIDSSDDALEPWILALLVILAATVTVLLVLILQRYSYVDRQSKSDDRSSSQAMTVAKGSVQIHKPSSNDDDSKKKVVVVVVNDPTYSSTYENDEERALPIQETTIHNSSSSAKKNYYLEDNEHDLMYASNQYFSASTSPAARLRPSNPFRSENEEEEPDNNHDAIPEDDSSSSSSSLEQFYHRDAVESQSSSSSSTTSSQGDPSSVIALLSEPMPMSILYHPDPSAALTNANLERRRPLTIQTVTNPLPERFDDHKENHNFQEDNEEGAVMHTKGRSLASGATTLHISPSLPDYGIVQFTEFPSGGSSVVDGDAQTVVAANPPISKMEEPMPEPTAASPVDASKPSPRRRTITKQRAKPLPARV